MRARAVNLRSRGWQLAVLPVFAVCALCTESVADEVTAADSSLSPREALIRSAMLPGWGQYSNGHPLKAALFGTSTAAFVAATWSKMGDLSDTSNRIRSTRRELQLAIAAERSDVAALQETLLTLEDSHQDDTARRNTYVLALFATATFAALDAYIDAHLLDFGETPTRLEMYPNAEGLLYGRVSWQLD